MNANDPGTIQPEDLIAYADGEATPDMREQVQAAPEARAQAAAYGQMQQRLQAALYRFECPSPQRLGEYDFGLVTPEERTQIAMHVIGCPLCADELQLLRGFLTTESLPTPVGVIERVRRLVAELVPLPLAAPQMSLRGADAPATRTYRAGDLTLSFDTGASVQRGRTALVGLIWREGAEADALAGTPVVLLTETAVIQTTTIDALGNVLFEEIPPGTYQVEVTLGDDIITITGLRIGN